MRDWIWWRFRVKAARIDKMGQPAYGEDVTIVEIHEVFAATEEEAADKLIQFYYNCSTPYYDIAIRSIEALGRVDDDEIGEDE